LIPTDNKLHLMFELKKGIIKVFAIEHQLFVFSITEIITIRIMPNCFILRARI